MITIYDSVGGIDQIPADAQYLLAYIDGYYKTYDACKRRFPNSRIFTVTTNGLNTADICDVEYGDATPDVAARGRAAGLYRTIYSNASTYNALKSAMGLQSWSWFAADWTGFPHLYIPSIATQYASPGYGAPGNYDISLAVDAFPALVGGSQPPVPSPVPPPDVPPPAPREESTMLCRNTHGIGYWAIRPSGDVYAYDGAPYIGPAPHFLTSWGIDAITNPVVGITDDGNGGFVFSCDKNIYPGTPALYHITPDGQFK